jgi:hypothetical protein
MLATRKFSAAINALLAEHLLSYVELNPQNPYAKTLADAVVTAVKARAKKGFDEAAFIEQFNAAPRFTQLNLIAYGFQQLGRIPQGASWRPVRKPFLPLENPKKIEKAQHLLFFQNGIDVRLRSGKFKLSQSGLSELRPGAAESQVS